MPNKLKTWLLKPVILALIALGLSGGAVLVTAAAASAATTVTGSTSMTNVPDTTNASGPACVSTTNGPSWATDQFPSVTLSATLLTSPANTWDVTITSNGSYVAFADPTSCHPLLSEGNITGSIQYIVTSPNTPKASGLSSAYNGATEFSTLIDDFFGGSPAISGGDVYDYSYQGGNYTQVGSEGGGLTIAGDVKPVACTVTVTNPGSQSSVLDTAISGLQIAASSNYPGTLYYDAQNLPKGLSISTSTGKITGTPAMTGTNAVTVTVSNNKYRDPQCKGSATFNWTVSLTAPSPAPSSSVPPVSGTVPVGGVQTGGTDGPVNGGLLPFGIAVLALGLIAIAGGVLVARRQRG